MNRKPKVVIAINCAHFSNPKRKSAQKMAMEIMVANKHPNIEIVSFNFPGDAVDIHPSIRIFKTLQKNSRQLVRNNRSMPYVKEILDSASRLNCNIFGYINSDILLSKEFFNIFNWNTRVYMFNRIDISGQIDINSFNNKSFNIVAKNHPGFDGFFFNKNWWLNNSNLFDEGLIIGEPEWDYYYSKIINRVVKDRNFIIRRLLYHEAHSQNWNLNSNGARNNRKINGTLS